jgi:hypothetical protein
MILLELSKVAGEDIKRAFAERDMYDPSMVSMAVKQVLAENMQSVIIAVFGSALQQTINQTLSSLPTAGYPAGGFR